MRAFVVCAVLLLGSACAATPAPTPTPGRTAAPQSTPTSTTSPAASPTSLASASPDNQPTPVSGLVPAISDYAFQEYVVPAGSHPHDVAPDAEGFVWYTAQASGELGRLDPRTGQVLEIPLGPGSQPHGVSMGLDGAPWVTVQGANTIATYASNGVVAYNMPNGRLAHPHTPTFDTDGILWFTGSTGVIGRLDPATGEVELFDAPGGHGPYGIDVTPGNDVWYVSLEQSYLGHVDRATGATEVFEPPTRGQGARRVWSDSAGRLWLTEWNAGQLAMFDPASREWREWPMPGPSSQPYAIYVDELDLVWITDFGTNELVRFNPATETFDAFEWPTPGAQVRQLLGRPGEVWGAESGADKIVVLRWDVNGAN